MKIVETKGKIAEDGSIILPPSVLKNMCVEAGDNRALTTEKKQYILSNIEKTILRRRWFLAYLVSSNAVIVAVTICKSRSSHKWIMRMRCSFLLSVC